MMFGKTSLEVKVGVFIFIGILILAGFVLLVGDFRSWSSGYNVSFEFSFANGVKIGAPVRFAGVDVGEVKELNIIFDEKAQLNKVNILAWVNKDVRIPLDSTIWVNTLGLLGEKYIEIMPGVNYNACLKPNGSIRGNDPIPMHEIAQIAREMVYNINDNLIRLRSKEGTVGRLLYDDALYKEFEKMIFNLEEFSSDLKKNPWKLFFKPKESKGKK